LGSPGVRLSDLPVRRSKSLHQPVRPVSVREGCGTWYRFLCQGGLVRDVHCSVVRHHVLQVVIVKLEPLRVVWVHFLLHVFRCEPSEEVMRGYEVCDEVLCGSWDTAAVILHNIDELGYAL